MPRCAPSNLGSPCVLAGASLLAAMALCSWVEGLPGTPGQGRAQSQASACRDCAPVSVAPVGTEAPRVSAREGENADTDQLRGLWARYERGGEGSALRFWYFHGDGKGLYRYGKVGLTHTHSFDYRVDGDELELRFRKSGEVHTTRVSIEEDGSGASWLSMTRDPRESGARYRRATSDIDVAATAARWWAAAAESQAEVSPQAQPGIGDRMWIDYRNYATGGSGFHMYQLAATALDGRGVGWFHRGDFDDWSTESLTYRITGDEIELFFDLREEPTSTEFWLSEEGGGRALWLRDDPRDFWATHRYLDGGRSFGGAEGRSQALDRVIGLQSRPQ